MLDDRQEFGAFESYCEACDVFGQVNDLGLCAECSAKLERDLIRQRAWDYSATAFGVRPEDREGLRAATIAKHRKALELIAPDARPEKRRRPRRRGK